MYIHNTLPDIAVNPNTVSGSDFDNNYQFSGLMNSLRDKSKNIFAQKYSPVEKILPTTTMGMGADEDELLRLHRTIVQTKSQVTEAQKKYVEVKSRLEATKIRFASEEKALAVLEQKNDAFLQIRRISEEGARDAQIHFDKVKSRQASVRNQRGLLDMLAREEDQLTTFINSKRNGEIPSLTQEFEAKAGYPYEGQYTPEPEMIIDKVDIINNETVQQEVQNDIINGGVDSIDPTINLPNNPVITDNVIPLVGQPELIGGGINPNDMYTQGNNQIPSMPNGFTNPKGNFLDKISGMIGISKQNTKYGLIGVGVIAVVLIVKNR